MRGRHFWALALVVAGVWILLDNLGVLPGFRWGIFLPILLILAGLAMILSRTGRTAEFGQVADSLALDGATSAQITFKHGAGRLRVSGGAPGGMVLAGTFAGGVEKETARRGETLDVALRTPAQGWSGWAFPWNWSGRGGGFDWDVRLSPDVGLVLRFETGAGESRLDFSSLRVGGVTLKTGASSTQMVLPANGGFTRVELYPGAAEVNVAVPVGVAAHVSGTMGLGALNVDQSRFPKGDAFYESADYTTAANRVEVRVDGGVGAVNVR
jgi:hypothetical protein